VIGYNDIKTANGVYFNVQRSSPCNSTGSSIPYEIERLNIGGAMTLASGVFTSPVGGRYYFSFASQSYTFNALSFVHLRVNGVVIGESYTPTNYYNMSLSASVNLKKGDQVYTFLLVLFLTLASITTPNFLACCLKRPYKRCYNFIINFKINKLEILKNVSLVLISRGSSPAQRKSLLQ